LKEEGRRREEEKGGGRRGSGECRWLSPSILRKKEMRRRAHFLPPTTSIHPSITFNPFPSSSSSSSSSTQFL